MQEIKKKQEVEILDKMEKETKELLERGGLMKGRGLANSIGRLAKGVDFRKLGREAKIASQIFTSPEDLLRRFELLGGSIMAGNNNREIEKEFVNIAHKLRDLGILNNRQLLSMLNSLF